MKRSFQALTLGAVLALPLAAAAQTAPPPASLPLLVGQGAGASY